MYITFLQIITKKKIVQFVNNNPDEYLENS